jgi:GNAT superfamily N-acetyltransferase
VCRCQRYRLARGEAFRSFPVEERRARQLDQAAAGEPRAPTTSGLVAFLGQEPVGWCAVGPRADLTGMVRNQRVPWQGRDEDRTDAAVWVVSCLLTRPGYRRRGVARALVLAAVPFARERGARALEAYPITTTEVITEELHVGLPHLFAEAGFTEVTRPTPRRAVVRLEL